MKPLYSRLQILTYQKSPFNGLIRLSCLSLLLFFFSTTTSAQDLYDINKVRDIKLQFAQDNWDVILDSLKQLGYDDRMVGKLTIDGVVYDSVGVRYKGNSSYYNVRKYEQSKLPFNIKLNYIKKDQVFKGGYKTLKLSNVFRDPSFMREALSYEIARNYMPAPRANFVRLYVNDELVGFYNCTESVDKNFLNNHYDYKKGVLIKCDPNWNAKQLKGCKAGEKASLMDLGSDSLCYQGFYELKTKNGWRELIQLCQVLNNEPEKIDTYLNVDQALWMHAFNNLLVNLDSYAGRLCHNYYLYQDSFGIFQPIIWDMNLSFGGFRFDGNSNGALKTEQMQKMSPFLHYKNDKRPLISKLLANSLNRKVYIAHLKTILKEQFEGDKFNKRVDQLQQNIDFYVKNDENKLYEYESFKENAKTASKAGKATIVGLEELMNGRIEYLNSHPLLKKLPPQISMVNHTKKDQKVFVSAKVENGTKAYLCYRMKKNEPFKRVVMKDDGESGDGTVSDSIFGSGVEWQKGLQYYIIAENDKTAMLSPERAAFEFYEVK